MASVNKVILVGNLGADPEIRALPNGDPVANIRLATTERYKDKASGEMRELTEWHRVVFFNRLAEVVRDYLKKGSSVYIEGRIRTRKWQDQSGQDRYSTEIMGDQMQMLGGRSTGTVSMDNDGYGQGAAQAPARASNFTPANAAPNRPSAPPAQAPASSGFDEMDDDIPF